LEDILSAKRIVVTRPRKQAGELVKLIKERGAHPVLFPVIETVWPDDLEPLDRALQQLEEYDWIFFTSVNGVQFFFQRLEQVCKKKSYLKPVLSLLNGIHIAAIGPKTEKELLRKGVQVSALPPSFKQEDLVREVTNQLCTKRKTARRTEQEIGRQEGIRILFPRAKHARKHLGQELRRMGIMVDEVETYQTIKVNQGTETLLGRLKRNEIDVITFTSSSAAKHFTELFEGTSWKEHLDSVTIACIGPLTAQTARELGIRVEVEATQYTIEGLIGQLEQYFMKKKV
jgi:uroporphyrinogen III methyltransferase/synthase